MNPALGVQREMVARDGRVSAWLDVEGFLIVDDFVEAQGFRSYFLPCALGHD